MNQTLMQSYSLLGRTRLDSQSRHLNCDGCMFSGSTLCRTIRDRVTLVGRRPGTRRFDRGMIIVEQGENPNFFGLLRRGFVRQERLRLNGDRIVLGLARPGHIVGGLPDLVSGCTSEAATDIEVCAFDRATTERLMRESPRFRQAVLSETSRDLDRLLDSAWRLNALDSRERIIAFLVDATRYMPTEAEPDGSLILQVEVSRQDWADLTNTAVETISRTMRYLKEKDIVISLTSSKFRIRDIDRLAFLAGIEGCARPLRGQHGWPQEIPG